jgi:hypothetical protein
MKLLDWFVWYILPAELVVFAVLGVIFYGRKKTAGRFILAAGTVTQALGTGIQRLIPISSIPNTNQGLAVHMTATPPEAWCVGYGLTLVGMSMLVLGFGLVVYRELVPTCMAREREQGASSGDAN